MVDKIEAYEMIPCALFIKDLKVSEQELLSDLFPEKQIESAGKSVMDIFSAVTLRVASVNNWTMFLDYWDYGIYHAIKDRKLLNKLGGEYELFWFATGDAFADYEITYYKNGAKIKEFEVIDEWDFRTLKENQGVRLPFEIPLSGKREIILEFILKVADYFGVDTTIGEVRYYKLDKPGIVD